MPLNNELVQIVPVEVRVGSFPDTFWGHASSPLCRCSQCSDDEVAPYHSKGGGGWERMWEPLRSPFGRSALLLLLLSFLTACSGTPTSQPALTHTPPTPGIAAGEPVLPHSQIFFANAPLPSPADLYFDNANWTLAGHDTASTRSTVLPACCNNKAPAPLWYHSLGVPLLDAPVIGDGHVYLLAADGYLHVLHLQSGQELWRIAVGGELTSNGLALAHGLVYLARAGHFVAALDSRNGREHWRFDTGGVVRAAPLVVGHVLLVASGSNTLWCLDALTGAKYWVFHSEDTLTEFWPTQTTPIVTKNRVYIALGASSEFNALNLQTGRKVWEVSLHERVTGGPTLDEAHGLLYLVTWSGRVVALDASSGSMRWETQLATGSESSPALSENLNMLYVGSFDGLLYALNASTGQLAWQTSLGSALTASPAVVQAGEQSWVVAAASGGASLIMDARTGHQLYEWRLGELRAPPVVAQGVLYQASLGDQGLFAFLL